MTKEEKQFNQWFDDYADGVKVFEEADMKQAYLQGRAELEAENKQIKNSDTLCKLIGEQKIKIAELEKENAEQKEKVNILDNCDRLGDMITEAYKDQLTKAKEIIKKFSEFANLEVEYDPEHPQEHTDLWNELCKEAEQFLSEVEKL